MKYLGIIPARFSSTRFPGKPLEKLGGKTIIERVYNKVENYVDELIVATDDIRFYDHVISFGGTVVMTSSNHKTGTDRCYEAYLNQGKDFDAIINIQGDEPFIRKEQIEKLKECLEDKETDIATLVKPFSKDDKFENLSNPNSPKVILNGNNFAIYFSRSIIPYLRDFKQEEWLKNHVFYKHIGIYGYKKNALMKITKLNQTPLEKAESLEQLRWIENNMKIKAGITEFETIGIDTPEDLSKAEEYLKSNKI